MEKKVSEKMGIKSGSRALLINATDTVKKDINLPVLNEASALRGDFDYIHFFAKTQNDLHKKFAALKKHLSLTGMLWISWPKGRKEGTDLSLFEVIRIGYDYGLVESKSLSVNDTWSAIKFTHPKKGKVYNNSYGKLK